MSAYRENLVDRLIHIYGLENPIVVEFCRYCENWADGEENDNLLTAYVETNEDYAFEED